MSDVEAQRDHHKEQAAERMRAAITAAVPGAIEETHDALKREADQWRGRPRLHAQRVQAALARCGREAPDGAGARYGVRRRLCRPARGLRPCDP